MRFLPTALAAIVIACSSPVLAADAPADAVVAAERAFAKAARDDGINAAFRAFIAPDGILFQPDPAPGPAQLAKGENKKGPPFLAWWPVYAGVARSGDLGFTTGPFIYGEDQFFGFYFTIWRKQADGVWKFLLDHGTDLNAKSPLTASAPVTFLPLAAGPDVGAAAAVERVRALEADLAAKAAVDLNVAYLDHIADDARLVGSGVEPAHGRAASQAELARRAPRADFSPLDAGASAAGDLVYTYGDARWLDDKGAAKRGHYVRLWQQRGDTWQLVFDEIVPRRGPPPPKQDN